MRALPPLALAALLAACGTLPQPFRGNPGQTAQRLASEPPIVPRLVVPTPATALLPDNGGKALAALLARDLQLHEVPAYAEAGQKGDWVLAISATDTGRTVVPVYTVRTPQGRDAATLKGTPVPVAAWAAASPATLQSTASEAASQLSPLLAGINNDLQRANPNSLLNRSARVAVLPVTGAPGDGDAALTRLMRANLSMRGEAVQDAPAGADFVVQGEVRVAPIAAGQDRVEIQWIVTQPSRAGTPSGAERGRVVQLNNVPAGSLRGVWGDVAQAVTEEASAGVRDLVLRQSGRTPEKAR
ncbi:MAG: hypothetical protein JOY66_07435 [Acetobacteraceae bacterium]|nr:hypothetical protein [Acetobacteraceae bacterium]